MSSATDRVSIVCGPMAEAIYDSITFENESVDQCESECIPDDECFSFEFDRESK